MIYSMTAFATEQSKASWGTLLWEIKSVNHRYFDISFRLPEAFRDLEYSLRELARASLRRGKIECMLKLQWTEQEASQIVFNEDLLNQLILANQTLSERLANSAPLHTMELLRWPGVVMEPVQDVEAIKQSIVSLFESTLKSFIASREREGRILKETILERLQQIKEQTQQLGTAIPELLELQRQKIIERIQEITKEVDQNRLEQELVYFAQRMDVAEELDRLSAHIQEMQRVCEKGGFVGRHLDFLSQEMNREANTLGSKSQHTLTSYTCVNIKVLIEQIREQVQNIE